MADEETANRLLVRIEIAQNKLDKQLAAVTKSAANGAANIEKSFKKSGQSVVQSVGAQRAAVSNLSFQLNDIAMGLASGTSPFTIMIQQGSQVSQALQGSNGLLGALKTVGGAFATMVNPISIASFALIGAAGAAVAYFTSIAEDTPAADTLIKGHADFIRQIKDAYGEAAIGAENYSSTSRRILEFETRDKIKEFKAALTEAATDLAEPLRGASIDAFEGATFTIGEVNGAINKLNDSVSAGNPDIKAFVERLIEISDQPGTPQQIRDIIKEIVESGRVSVDAQQKLGQLTGFINGVGQAAADQVGQVNALNKAISTLANIALPALTDMEQATKAYQEGLAKATSGDERVALNKAFTDAQNRISASMMPTPADKPNRESEAPDKPTKPKRTAEDRTREKAARDAEREKEAVTDLIDKLEFENSIIGLTAVEREKAIELRRVEKGATEGQRQQISSLIDAQYAEKKALAQVNEQMQMLSDLGRDTLGGFISDMTEGKNATEALGNALKKVGDQLLNSGLDALFGTGGKDSGFGFLGQLLGIGGGGSKFAGGGDLRYFPPVPGYAKGTRNAPGGLSWVGERGPELMNVPRGSQVIPNAPSMKALGRSGGVNVTYAPQNNFQGTSEELAQMRKQMAADRAQFESRTIATIRKANNGGVKF